MHKDSLIEHERMFSECGTAENSVHVFQSKILMQLENWKVWQPSGKPWACDFCLYQRAFPRTYGASMQCWLWYMRNVGCSGCQECKNMCCFYGSDCVEKG